MDNYLQTIARDQNPNSCQMADMQLEILFLYWSCQAAEYVPALLIPSPRIWALVDLALHDTILFVTHNIIVRRGTRTTFARNSRRILDKLLHGQMCECTYH